jgi:predicted Na+-dependent transporter
MQQKQFDATMANQGIAPGSEAYANAARVFQQGQNDQRTSAITGGMGVGLSANQQQFAQNLAKYQLPMTIASQIKALSTPGYVNPASQATTAGADIMGAMGLANQNDQANANAANARSNAMMSGMFSLGGAGINKWG